MEKFIIKHKSFKKCVYLEEKVKPERFLWHVTNPGFYYNRESLYKFHDHWRDKFINNFRKSIMEKGLKFGQSNAIYAHNELSYLKEMYPLWIDDWVNIFFTPPNQISKGVENLKWMRKYDFWRIDTEIYDGPWYVDPFVHDEAQSCMKWVKPHNYVCTPYEIPPEAIQLFVFDQELYQEPFFVQEDGVASVSGRKKDMDGLVPFMFNGRRMAA
jgi:hypothetical protein